MYTANQTTENRHDFIYQKTKKERSINEQKILHLMYDIKFELTVDNWIKIFN